jgi:sulfate permease, SulP family
MLFLAGPMGKMPQATLAAVVIVYSIGLIQPIAFLDIRRVRTMEFRWALVACAGVVLLGTLKGILVAIIVSLIGLAQQAFDPPVYVLRRKRGTNVFRPVSPEHQDDESIPGLLLLRVEGRVFFANAFRIGEKMLRQIDEAKPKVVGLDLAGVFDLEYTALKALTEAEQRMREGGTSIWLIGLNPEVLRVVQRSALGKALGTERMHQNLEIAVQKYQATGEPRAGS